jgi:hypothetical protein
MHTTRCGKARLPPIHYGDWRAQLRWFCIQSGTLSLCMGLQI